MILGGFGFCKFEENFGLVGGLRVGRVRWVAALDLTLTHVTMPAQMKLAVLTAVTNDTAGNLSRVETGAWLILSSSYYNVWH